MKTRENIYFALILGATMVTLLGSAGKAIAFHPGAGHTYQVLVTRSDGTQFTECFRYNADGTLTIDLLGNPGVFGHVKLGATMTKTLGINAANPGLGLATHAQHTNRFRKIKGDVISTAGAIFTITGFENPGCVVTLGSEANLGLELEVNPYQAP